ncbi:unnamed protein product [Toxocara canis]|uniref:Hexosyltransferase n=1 Tax=Toxocara canis TaxID=6265 RepID=A0A183U4F7_TOXCA|nr:unnamed protein product [Toxocara canis]
MLFVLGTSNNGDKKERILEESSTYHDIIQQDFLDAYRNLTWKALAWLRFVDEYCATARYVLKIDDDVVFDAIGLLKYLHIDERNSTEIKNENRIICGLFQGTNLVPVRKKGSKWYIISALLSL